MAGPNKAGLAHQPSDAFAGMPLALLAQVGVDARRAIGLVRVEVDGADPLFSSTASAIALAEGTRLAQAQYPAFDMPSTLAITMIGKSA